MEEADYLCDRVAIIDRGKILAIDSPENLKEKIGGDIISLRASDTKKLEKIYKKESYVKNIKMHDGHINLYVEKPEKRIPKIIEMATKAKVEIHSANIHRPTLEDVFLHYTGRKIREEGADARERMREHIRMRTGVKR
jgi:ABC-2 type transport system ATP-binding protein